MKIEECKTPGEIVNILKNSEVLYKDKELCIVRYTDIDLMKNEHKRYMLVNLTSGPICYYDNFREMKKALVSKGIAKMLYKNLRGGNHEI